MPPQHRGEETRERILEAALDAFARYGYRATGVAEICRRAGATKGAFYHHFPSKEAVFLEMLERWLGRIEGRLVSIRSGDATVPQELDQMTAMVQEVFREAGGKLSIFLEFLVEAAHSPTVWQATVVPLRQYRAYFAELLQEGVEEGSLHAVDPSLASNVLLSFATGVLALGLLDPEGEDWGGVARRGMGLLLDGFRQR
jgi:AcrR family transcriptional regulator